ncbi:hypothetical protein CDCA_CDCA01G0250 [Cyanidium caldarium]|uniref:Ribosomal silencing factor RsfS n=1 Tax=Cyanidium caldarium TaxID=2771 RepID=A0AAV9IQ54_CYACA|nr:hypothetical protein CDCA_CDCA01G0250 [Cyanidium caldarium]
MQRVWQRLLRWTGEAQSGLRWSHNYGVLRGGTVVPASRAAAVAARAEPRHDLHRSLLHGDANAGRARQTPRVTARRHGTSTRSSRQTARRQHQRSAPGPETAGAAANSTTAATSDSTPPTRPTMLPLPQLGGRIPPAQEIARWLESENARHVVVLDISARANFTDTFVIATAMTTGHAYRLADVVRKALMERDVTVNGEEPYIEGRETGEWMLIDVGATVVHIMVPWARERYDLERLWTTDEEDDEGEGNGGEEEDR